jgi:hypothetical protein
MNIGSGFSFSSDLIARRLYCEKCESRAVTANTWTSLVDGDGPGVLRRLMFALPDTARTAARIRITFDGAATPQVGGVDGLPLDVLFGSLGVANHVSSANIYQTCWWGQSVMNTTPQFSAYCDIPMPFSGGFDVEVKTEDDSTWYMMAYYQPNATFHYGPSYRFYAKELARGLAGSAESIIFDQSIPVALLGFVHKLVASDSGTLEGNWKIKYGSDLTLGYESSGWEDVFDFDGWYLLNSSYKSDTAGVLKKSGGDYIVYTMFGRQGADWMPADPNRLQLLLNNGSATDATAVTYPLFYATTAPSFTTPAAPSGLAVDTVLATSLTLSWDDATGSATGNHGPDRGDVLQLHRQVDHP